MKLFFNLFGMAAAGVLGYLAEPHLRFQLTGERPSAVEMARDKKVILQLPDGVPRIDLASLTPEQLPQRVLLNTDVKVADAATGTAMIIQAGNRVKLVRIEGGNAVVSPGQGPYLGLVPVTETDLFQQIAAHPPGAAPVAPPVAVVPEPVIPATGESEGPAAMAEPAPEAESAPETPPAPESMPMPEAAPAAAAGSPDAVKAMQDSIKAAQIKEFTFDQVLEWKAEGDEIVDGETYQTGLASYKAETIFGVKTIQAKALIKGGKVQRWIWPKSGMEIK